MQGIGERRVAPGSLPLGGETGGREGDCAGGLGSAFGVICTVLLTTARGVIEVGDDKLRGDLEATFGVVGSVITAEGIILLRVDLIEMIDAAFPFGVLVDACSSLVLAP